MAFETPVGAFAVRVHPTGRSPRETKEISRLLGADGSHQTISSGNVVPPTASPAGDVHEASLSCSQPKRGACVTAQPLWVVVDETAVRSPAIDIGYILQYISRRKLRLDVQLFERRGPGPAAPFPHGATGIHDRSETVFRRSTRLPACRSRLGLRVGSTAPSESGSKRGFTPRIRVDRFRNSEWAVG